MRSRTLGRIVGLTEAGVVVVAVVLGLALRPAQAAATAPVTARVTRCDVSSPGAAQVTYAVTNAERKVRNYRVELTVATGTAPVGWGVSLVNGVRPGATTTGHALLPLTGDQAGARCTARASAYEGHAGHHT